MAQSRFYRQENILLHPLLLAALTIFVLACEQNIPSISAPLNDRATLEKLAQSYKEISNQFPTSPVNLAPQARRKFVEQVFSQAGFSFSKTLTSLSAVKKVDITKLHRDMQELLFLPHYRLQQEAMKDIYSEKELSAIAKIEITFK